MTETARVHSTPPSALGFLTVRLLDRQAGGCFGATDVTGEFPLSVDKQLTDQSSAVLALAESGSDDDLDVALDGLRNMHDRNGQPGFVESTDRYWRARPAGRVRSLRFQLHAAAALLAGAHRRDDDELRARAVDLLNRCLSVAEDGVFPTQLTEDWRDVLDRTESPQTAVSAVRAIAVAEAIGESGVDSSGLPAIARGLAALVERVSWPAPARELTRCSSLARVAISLAQAGRMLGADEHLKAAHTVLGVAEQFHDPEDGGFWDRLDPAGQARVDWLNAPSRGRAPFPVKRAADAAQLLLAGRLLRSCNLDIPELVVRAEAAIADLVDRRHGGVYLGVGYHWPTSTDHGSRSVRQVWARPAQPGLTLGGALGTLALQQKSVHTQATVARATIGTAPPIRPDHPVRTVRAVRDEVTIRTAGGPVDWPPAADASVLRGIDRPGPLPALLGPPVADAAIPRPDGTGSDSGAANPARLPTEPQHPDRSLAAAYHAVTGLRLLSGEVPVPVTLVRQVMLAQGADGGFGEQAGLLTDVASTHHAAVTLWLAGAAPPAGAADYLRRCQNPDGGFGAVPGMVSDLGHTAFALAALRILRSGVPRPAAVGAFVSSCRRPDGGYGDRPGRPADTFSVRHAVAAQLLLSSAVPDPQGVRDWLRTTALPGGGFAHRPGRGVSLTGTHHAVAALAMLGATAGLEACERWLNARHDTAGAFGSPGAALGDDGFAHLQSLAALRGAVNRSWLAVVG